MELDRAIATTIAIVDAVKALEHSCDLVANTPGRVPPEVSESTRYLIAIGDLQKAVATIAEAAGIPFRVRGRWATAQELRAELAAEKPAIERAEVRASLSVVRGGRSK